MHVNGRLVALAVRSQRLDEAVRVAVDSQKKVGGGGMSGLATHYGVAAKSPDEIISAAALIPEGERLWFLISALSEFAQSHSHVIVTPRAPSDSLYGTYSAI